MFKWFKKKEIKKVPNPSSIAPLYIASTNQIEGTIAAVNELSPKIDDLQNRLDQLPPIPDLSAYARKDQANTFTQKQTFNNGMYLNNKKIQGLLAPSEAGDATHKKYVDDADNTKLREAKTYTDTKTNEKLQESKTYTDTQIAAIPPVDLSNVAKLNAENVFTVGQRINGNLTIQNEIFSNVLNGNAGKVQSVGNDPKSIVNKEYVDNKTGSNPIILNANEYNYTSTKIHKDINIWVVNIDIDGSNSKLNTNKKYRCYIEYNSYSPLGSTIGSLYSIECYYYGEDIGDKFYFKSLSWGGFNKTDITKFEIYEII